MVDYREILRLQSLGNNITQIAEALHSSRNTIRDVEKLAGERNIRWPLGEELTNQRLYELLYPDRLEKAQVYMEPDCRRIHQELAKKVVNLTLLWTEYKSRCTDAGRVPYQYTQFCDIYRAWAKKSKATMRIQHKPGDAYEYLDGIPRLLIPDNLRTEVTRNTRLDTIINRSYAELANHYDTAIIPARVRRPRDKSLADAKAAVAAKLEEFNGYPFKKREGNRREAYLLEEREFMQPLPANPYEPAIWSEQTVLLDYAVTDSTNILFPTI